MVNRWRGLHFGFAVTASASSARGGLPAIMLCALAVRGGALALVPGALQKDTDLYRQIAENLLATGSFALGGTPTAFRPPLYPLLLVPCAATGEAAWLATAVLHLLLGLLTVAGVWFVGHQVGGPLVAGIAAFLVAVDPLLVWQSTQLMSETACVAVVAGCFATATQAWTSRRWLACLQAGFLAGLAALCRANLLPWSALVPLALALAAVSLNEVPCQQFGGMRSPPPPTQPPSSGRELSGRSCCRMWFSVSMTASVCACGVLLAVVPWATRNRSVLGHWIFGTTHSGVTLLLANNDDFYDHIASGKSPGSWRSEGFHRQWSEIVARSGVTHEADIDALAYRLAWETIRRRPADFLKATFLRVAWLWSPLPEESVTKDLGSWQGTRWAVAGFYALSYLAAVGGLGQLIVLSRKDARARVILYLGVGLAAVLTGVHAVYWSNIRMRAPVTPFLALLSAIGVWTSLTLFRCSVHPSHRGDNPMKPVGSRRLRKEGD